MLSIISGKASKSTDPCGPADSNLSRHQANQPEIQGFTGHVLLPFFLRRSGVDDDSSELKEGFFIAPRFAQLVESPPVFLELLQFSSRTLLVRQYTNYGTIIVR